MGDGRGSEGMTVGFGEHLLAISLSLLSSPPRPSVDVSVASFGC